MSYALVYAELNGAFLALIYVIIIDRTHDPLLLDDSSLVWDEL